MLFSNFGSIVSNLLQGDNIASINFNGGDQDIERKPLCMHVYESESGSAVLVRLDLISADIVEAERVGYGSFTTGSIRW